MSIFAGAGAKKKMIKNATELGIISCEIIRGGLYENPTKSVGGLVKCYAFPLFDLHHLVFLKRYSLNFLIFLKVYPRNVI